MKDLSDLILYFTHSQIVILFFLTCLCNFYFAHICPPALLMINTAIAIPTESIIMSISSVGRNKVMRWVHDMMTCMINFMDLIHIPLITLVSNYYPTYSLFYFNIVVSVFAKSLIFPLMLSCWVLLTLVLTFLEFPISKSSGLWNFPDIKMLTLVVIFHVHVLDLSITLFWSYYIPLIFWAHLPILINIVLDIVVFVSLLLLIYISFHFIRCCLDRPGNL